MVRGNGFTLDYRKPPKPTASSPYGSFAERIERVEDDMWWRAAHDVVMLEPHAVPPVIWSFYVRCCDFWRHRDCSASPAPALLARGLVEQGKGLADLLCSGNARAKGKLFGPGPGRRPRHEDAAHDLIAIWSAATSLSDRAIPLFGIEVPSEAVAACRKAARELGITPAVKAYAAGVPLEDVLAGFGCR